MYRYTVKCTFDTDDLALVDRWLDWLRDEHIARVMDCGATGAEIVRMDEPAAVFEIRYRFASEAAFHDYEARNAPRLREEGLKKFPLELGLVYVRSAGEVVLRR